jgi:hypothetical protein
MKIRKMSVLVAACFVLMSVGRVDLFLSIVKLLSKNFILLPKYLICYVDLNKLLMQFNKSPRNCLE